VGADERARSSLAPDRSSDPTASSQGSWPRPPRRTVRATVPASG